MRGFMPVARGHCIVFLSESFNPHCISRLVARVQMDSGKMLGQPEKMLEVICNRRESSKHSLIYKDLFVQF